MILQILGLIVIGAVIGVLARLIKPGRQRMSMLATILLGIVGAIIGGLIASLLGTGDVFELNIIGSIVAIAAAAFLIIVGDRVGAITKRDRR